MFLPTLFPANSASALHWRRSFPGEPVQAAAVRRFLATLLDDCPFLDEVLLAADELVVNAITHTKSGGTGGMFTLHICRRDALVAVAVTDQGGPTEPAAVEADAEGESGRGLRTVSAIAASWGWFGNERARTVTAVFALAADRSLAEVA